MQFGGNCYISTWGYNLLLHLYSNSLMHYSSTFEHNLTGQEITINYKGLQMENLKSRQDILCSNYGFKCDCELCQKEFKVNDDEMYIVIFLFNKCFKYNFHYLQGYFWKIREIATNILNKIIIITVLLKISWNRNKFTK